MTNLIKLTRDLSDRLDALPSPAGVITYNPLRYMRAAHECYLERFCDSFPADVLGLDGDPHRHVPIASTRSYLILGMNPGPWGMVQTGVPFGDVRNAAEILRLTTRCPHPSRGGRHEWYMHKDGTICHACGEVEKVAPALAEFPPRMHPQRPVLGFACARREASGERLWGGLSTIWEDTLSTKQTCVVDVERVLIEAVLGDCFAMNYCPLAYFAEDERGTNVTPEEFRKSGPRRDLEYAAALEAACTPYLSAVIEAMQVKTILAVGRYAEGKAKIVAALRPANSRPRVVYLTHPSPLATRSAAEWATNARAAMSTAGVLPTKTGGAS